MHSTGMSSKAVWRAGAIAGDPCHHAGMAGGEPQERPNEDEDDGEAAESEHESTYSLLRRGHELMRRGHHAQAAVVLERASQAEPGKGSILEALGRAHYNSGQHERSRESFEALLEIDPSAHYAQFALGQSLKQLGRRREARTHLKLAVALSPSSKLYRQALERLGEPSDRPGKQD
jgi:tetratricopeptide (TPR) repeat protein